MASEEQIAAILFEVGQAVGTYLAEDRVGVYFEKLRKYHEKPLRLAADRIIETWDNPARFPPVGVFVTKIRDFTGEGTPNALGAYVTEPDEAAKRMQLKLIRESTERQRRIEEMSEEEYWQYIIDLRKRLGHGPPKTPNNNQEAAHG